MKRIAVLLIALILLAAPGALAEGGRLLDLRGEYIDKLLSDGTTLYVPSDDGLFTWRAGEDDVTKWQSEIRPAGDNAGADPERARDFSELALFTREGDLWAACLEQGSDGSAEGFLLMKLAFTDWGTVEAAEVTRLKASAEVRGESFYAIIGAAQAEGRLALLLESETGQALCALDPENPEKARVEPLEDWDYRLIPAAEGALLVHNDYEDERTILYAVHGDGGFDELCALPQRATAVGADANTGAVYAVVDGRACAVDVDTGAMGAAMAALPLQPEYGAVLDGGRLYAVNMSGKVALLDTAGVLNEDDTLTFRGGVLGLDWVSDALVEYSVLHPECQTALAGGEVNVLQDMLNRSGDCDIYLLGSGDGATLEALLDRGYMLPLEGEATRALTEGMYPAFRNKLAPEGTLLALPVSVGGSGMGIGERALEKLGLSLDDVPGDWMGFVDFLENEIKPRLDRLDEFNRFTYDEITDKGFSFNLRDRVLGDFIAASVAAGRIPDYEDPRLVQVLERLEGIDFGEYGLPEEKDDGQSGYSWSSDTQYLFQLDANYALGDGGDTGIPLALGFGDDLPGVLPLDFSVIFVNPFSARAGEAVALVNMLAEKLPPEVRYNLCPDLDEPVRRPDADLMIARFEAYLEEARVRLESAEPANRQALEDELNELQRDYDSYLADYLWLISREQIDRYRANGDRLVMAAPNWFSKDDSGEAYELLRQYAAGILSTRDFLAAVNQKARMMEMEG